MNKSGYGKDGIYRSLRPALFLPSDPNLSLVSFLFRNSFLYSDKLALVDADTEETLTFNQFKSMVAKVSHGLVQMGIKQGDIVLIFAPNSIKYPVCFLGIVALGAIATTVNPLYTVAEISKQIKDSGPKLVITVTELWDKVKGFGLPVLILGSSSSSEMVPNSRITYFSDLVKMAGPVSCKPKLTKLVILWLEEKNMSNLMVTISTAE